MSKVVRLKGTLIKKEIDSINKCFIIDNNFEKIDKTLTFENEEYSDFKITIEKIKYKTISLTVLYHDKVIFCKVFSHDRNNASTSEILGIIKIEKQFENEEKSFIINIMSSYIESSEDYLNLLWNKFSNKSFNENFKNKYIYTTNQIIYSDFNNIEDFVITTWCLLFSVIDDNDSAFNLFSLYDDNNSVFNLFSLYEEKLNYFIGYDLKYFLKKDNNYSLDSYLEEYENFSTSNDIVKYLIGYVANIKYDIVKPSKMLTDVICKDIFRNMC